MIRVLLADDHILFSTLLEERLKKDADIEVVALAADGAEAVALTEQLEPDVVLLDVQMPVMTGTEALREIKAKLPRTKVILLTTFQIIEGMTENKIQLADGYLLKDIRQDILIMAVKCVYNDLVIFQENVYSIMMERSMRDLPQGRTLIGNIPLEPVDVLIIKHIAEGKTNRHIARILNYSEGTVKNKVTKILDLTGLSDRTELSVFAIKYQII